MIAMFDVLFKDFQNSMHFSKVQSLKIVLCFDSSKAALPLWIFFIFILSLSLPYCHVCILQPCGHLLGKGLSLGSPVCDVFLCFCHFPFVSWVRRGT